MSVVRSICGRLPIDGMLYLLLGTCAFSQHVSVGVVGGSALTNDFTPLAVPDTTYVEHSTSKDYIIGPMLAISIPAGFSVEADALYRPMNFIGTSPTPSITVTVSTRSATVVTWEFPVLLQYRFKLSALPLHPLVEVGPSFRNSGNANGTSPSSEGFTAGAGIQAGFWKLKVAPQMRYTRWAADGAHYPAAPSTKQDQLELLVSLSF